MKKQTLTSTLIEILENRLDFVSTKLGASEVLVETNTVRDVCNAYIIVLKDLRKVYDL